jgi:undecaprenyl-diphosphatase
VIQVGAIAAVALLYWEKILGMLRGMIGRNGPGIRLLRNIILAFAPVAAAGFYLGKVIDRHLFSIGAVVAALISGAVLMFAAERWRRTAPNATDNRKEPHDPHGTPGARYRPYAVPRPLAGNESLDGHHGGRLFLRLEPRARGGIQLFGGPATLAGAAVYKGAQAGPAMVEVFGWPPLILGTAVAAGSAAIAVRFLVRYLTHHGLALFAVYRLILAAVLVGWFLV